MKKKILIGSLLVLILLLLIPSVPAIQQKSVDEGIKQDLKEKLDTISLDASDDIVPELLHHEYSGFTFIVGKPEVLNYNQIFGKRYVHIKVGNGNLIVFFRGGKYLNPTEWIPVTGFISDLKSLTTEDFR